MRCGKSRCWLTAERSIDDDRAQRIQRRISATSTRWHPSSDRQDDTQRAGGSGGALLHVLPEREKSGGLCNQRLVAVNVASGRTAFVLRDWPARGWHAKCDQYGGTPGKTG